MATCLRPPHECLSVFRDHFARWRGFRYKRIDRYDIPLFAPIWDLFGGIWAQGLPAVPDEVDCSREFRFIELPSVIRGTQGRSWTFKDVGIDVRDFRMIPERNLLALIVFTNLFETAAPLESEVHLRTLSENSPHPEAAGNGILRHQLNQRCRFSFTIEIQDDLLALLYIPTPLVPPRRISRQVLVIWNWITGAKLLVHESSPDRNIGSYALIDSKRIMLCTYSNERSDCPANAQLEICSIIDNNVISTGADKDTADTERPSKADLAALAAFEFPRINTEYEILSMGLRVDPPPTRGNGNLYPFIINEYARIYTVQMEMSTPVGLPLTLTMFVRLPNLLKLYNQRHPSTHNECRIPWSTWGPDSTRLFMGRMNPRSWVCFCYGEKVIQGSTTGETPRAGIYDFSPSAVQTFPEVRGFRTSGSPTRFPSPGDLGDEPAVYFAMTVSEPTEFPSVDADGPVAEVFMEKVTTRLPYHVRQSSWGLERGSVLLMDSEHIITLQENRDAGTMHMVCLTF